MNRRPFYRRTLFAVFVVALLAVALATAAAGSLAAPSAATETVRPDGAPGAPWGGEGSSGDGGGCEEEGDPAAGSSSDDEDCEQGDGQGQSIAQEREESQGGSQGQESSGQDSSGRGSQGQDSSGSTKVQELWARALDERVRLAGQRREQGALPEVAERELSQAQEAGELLVHAGYLDLLGRVWGCVTLGAEGSAVRIVAEDDGGGACTVRVLELPLEQWEEALEEP